MTTQIAPALWQLEWTFGDRLRKVRRVLGLTTVELGETLGVTGQAVSNLEGRTNTPRQAFEIASRLEQEYGVPAWWVLGHEKAPNPDGPGASWRAREDSNPQPSDP